MKIRLAKKIMKHRPEFVYGDALLNTYFGFKMFLYDFNLNKDNRITKAISLTSKRKKHDKFKAKD